MPILAELFEEALRHHQSGQLAQAENLYRQILQADPRHAEAWHFLGVLAGQTGQYDRAVEYIGHALSLKPSYAEALYDLGNLFRLQGKLEEALTSFLEVLRLKPDVAEVHYNLGLILRRQGKSNEALKAYRQAIRLKPHLAGAYNNLGVILQEQGELKNAASAHQEAIRLKPAYAEAFFNLGNVLRAQGKLDEAAASYQEALRLKPDVAECHFNLSQVWLLQGNFAKGWPGYEWRRRTKDNLAFSYSPPSWDGTALAGRTILLYAEQGLGDTLQFVRYARLVKDKGGRVLVQCQPGLAGILTGCPGIDQLTLEGTPLPEFHVSAPLLSLPLLLGTTLETIPAQVPYLTVDLARVRKWRDRLAAIPGFKVGICWQGNPVFGNDRSRSVPLIHFAPLAAVPGVSLVALQRGPGLEQMAQVAEHFKIVDLPGRSEEPAEGWMDTAALIQALDLVISIDTAAAHLAGALAAPVWVTLPFVPEWRWLLNREGSPWYPTTRLFRQTESGQWPEVFQRIAVELRQRANTGQR